MVQRMGDLRLVVDLGPVPALDGRPAQQDGQ